MLRQLMLVKQMLRFGFVKSGLRRFFRVSTNKLTTRCNTPIQGAGAAVLKRTLGKLWPLLQAESEEVVKLAGVVHDEVILLVRQEDAERWAKQLAVVMEEAEAEWLGRGAGAGGGACGGVVAGGQVERDLCGGMWW
jgi:hypothetical protein